MKNKLLLLLFLGMTLVNVAQNTEGPDKHLDKFDVPVDYYKLDNGLKVILSPDKTSPTVVVGIY